MSRQSELQELPEELTPRNNEVVTKYKNAGEIATRVLKLVCDAAIAGAKVSTLCALGDSKILEETSNIYKKAKDGVKIEKGIAFPTCVSVNNTVCHFSPLDSDPQVILADGDLVKIELGVHIDGFPAQIGTTIVVGASKEKPVKGKQADLLVATYTAAQAAMRLVKSGKNNIDAVEPINKIASSYGCQVVEGFTSHNVEKDLLDGDKVIFFRPTDTQKKEVKEVDFEDYEVYTIDILLSTGEGKCKRNETRTTVFKKNNVTYMLKLKTSRAVLKEINTKFGYMAFSLRNLEEENTSKMGIVECINHNLVTPFDVLYEKEGEYVGLSKFTVMLTPTGSLLITNPPPLNNDIIKSDIKLSDINIKNLLNTSLKKSAPPPTTTPTTTTPAASTSK